MDLLVRYLFAPTIFAELMGGSPSTPFPAMIGTMNGTMNGTLSAISNSTSTIGPTPSQTGAPVFIGWANPVLGRLDLVLASSFVIIALTLIL